MPRTHASLPFGVDAAHAAAVLNGAGKYAETTAFHNVRHVCELHAETKVRLIGTEAVHGLLPGHPPDRKLYIHVQHLFKQFCKITLIHIDDIVYIHK